MVSWEFDLFPHFFCSILADCLGIYCQWMSLVSCRGQQMLTQGPTADSKCKLNISSFLILPHQLDCLICAKNIIMNIVMLLEMKGESAGGVGRFRAWAVGQREGIVFFQFFVLFLWYC